MTNSNFVISKNVIILFLSLLVVFISGTVTLFTISLDQNNSATDEIYYSGFSNGDPIYNGCLSSCKNQLGIDKETAINGNRSQLTLALKECMTSCFVDKTTQKSNAQTERLSQAGLSQEDIEAALANLNNCINACETNEAETGNLRQCTQACRAEIINPLRSQMGQRAGIGQTNPLIGCMKDCKTQGGDVETCVQSCASQYPQPSRKPISDPIIPIPTVNPY